MTCSPAAAAVRSPSWKRSVYRPAHQTWPYKPQDFNREDPSSDGDFYQDPRFVTHISTDAINSLSRYYDVVLPRRGRILDFCSSWVSHYPDSVQQAIQRGELQAVGMGMNQKELAANKDLNAGRILQDLNVDPSIPQSVTTPATTTGRETETLLDASTCVVSIDYLTQPVKVLQSLRTRTKPGGSVHLVVSNRCFPTKAIDRWLRISETERLNMVGDYLHFAGWKQIEILDLKSGEQDDGALRSYEPQRTGLQAFMKSIGMGSQEDPLWVVRAIR